MLRQIGCVGLLALCCSVSCDRSEADRAPATSATARETRQTTPTVSTPSPSQVPSEPAPDCLVPMPAEAPPEASAAAECPPSPDAAPDLPHGWVRFPDSAGAPAVEVEIARVSAHRQRGLMYRTQLADDAGMLFSWPNESVRSFWMRNTCIPLDMLFISGDGVIVGILEHVPTLNEAPRRVACPAAHVLEVNAGWARAHGVRPGQRVDFDT